MASKLEVHYRILANKEGIIQKYNDGMRVPDIAKFYGVGETVIYDRLKEWGVRLVKRRRARGIRQKARGIRQKAIREPREFSPWLMKKMKQNKKINENDKGYKHFDIKQSKSDERLIHNFMKSLL